MEEILERRQTSYFNYLENFEICQFQCAIDNCLSINFPLYSESSSKIIRKTCPYNVYPIEPHFYIAKLGYAGVYLFFLFLLQNIDCGYSLEPPRPPMKFSLFFKLKKFFVYCMDKFS